MIERKQNKKIAYLWSAELDIATNDQYLYLFDGKLGLSIVINLVNEFTGEIRQKRVTIDQIARRCCESEISSSSDISLEDI